MSVARVPRWIAQSIVGIGLVLSLGAVFGAEAPEPQGAAQVPQGAAKDECPAGFSGSPEKGCVDVNECTNVNGGCSRLAMCVNTAGSRTCGLCPEGFAGNGYVGCFDANECPNGDCTSRLPIGAEDAAPPVITTSGNVTVPATSPEGAVAKFTAAGRDKLDGDLPAFCTPASGAMFPVGKTTVSCWASNSLGKLKNTTLTVTVTK
jgi:hypothetical protein